MTPKAKKAKEEAMPAAEPQPAEQAQPEQKAVKKKEHHAKESEHKDTDNKNSQQSKDSSKKQGTVLQPEINIGLVGHVDHGKTTLTERLSGKWTDTHSEEMKRGITIRLGYADTTFYKCQKCHEPDCYSTKPKCPNCGAEGEVLRMVSFVDAPGHESLMATMLAGATIMDGALLLVAANESCPQPQTREHLMALQIMGIKNIIIVQNKIDLVTEEQATKNYQQIRDFLKNSEYKDSPIIPISAQHNLNIDFLIQTIQTTIPTPKRDPTKDPIMYVARSFDVNKPGSDVDDIVGGVLGGALVQGVLKTNDEIEIKPGRKIERENKVIYEPMITFISSLKTGGHTINEIHPGGSVGVMTMLDPSLVKSDSLTGSVIGKKGKLPKVWYELVLEPHLLERVVGSKEDLKVEPVKLGEMLMLNVNAAATVGIVDKLEKGRFHCRLKLPVCTDLLSRVTISRRVGTRFRLIGYGIIKE